MSKRERLALSILVGLLDPGVTLGMGAHICAPRPWAYRPIVYISVATRSVEPSAPQPRGAET